MSSWNSARRKKYSASSSSAGGVQQFERRLERVDQVGARRLQVGQLAAAERVAGGRRGAGSYQRVGLADRGARRGAVGSARSPRWRCTLREIQRSWNQPMWPSDHSGGSSSAATRGSSPASASGLAAERRLERARPAQGVVARVDQGQRQQLLAGERRRRSRARRRRARSRRRPPTRSAPAPGATVERQVAQRHVGLVEARARPSGWAARRSRRPTRTGTIRASATTPGRRVSILPCIATLARLPKGTWIAPDSTATEPTWSLTMRSATGRPAAALSTGTSRGAAQARRSCGPTNSVSLTASTTCSRISPSGTPGKREQGEDGDDRDDDHQLEQREADRGGATGDAGGESRRGREAQGPASYGRRRRARADRLDRRLSAPTGASGDRRIAGRAPDGCRGGHGNRAAPVRGAVLRDEARRRGVRCPHPTRAAGRRRHAAVILETLDSRLSCRPGRRSRRRGLAPLPAPPPTRPPPPPSPST